MTGFILKIFIFIAFFVNTNIKAGDGLNETKKINRNPYLSKVKSLKEIRFDELGEFIKKNNLEYKTFKEKFNQATYELKATLKLKYPTIDLQSNGLPSYLISDEYRNPSYNSSTNFESNQLEASLSTLIKWDIIDPERKPEIAIKRLEVDKSKNALMMIFNDLILKAESQYYLLQSLRAKVNTAKIMVESSESSLKTAITKNKALLVPDLEVIEAETQLLRDKRLLNNSLKNEAEVVRELSVTLGIYDNFYPLSNEEINIKGIWNNSFEDTKKYAQSFNKKLKDLDLEIKISEKRIKKSKALILPKLSLVNTLTGSYKFGQEEVTPPISKDDYRRNLNNTIALTTQWRIFDGGRSRDLKKKNISKKEEFKAKFELENKNINKNLEDLYSELESSKKDIINSYVQLNKQEEILNISDKRFKAGVASQREIINNQRDLLFARNAFIDSVTFYNTNLISLKRISGDLQITKCTNKLFDDNNFKTYDPSSEVKFDPCSINFKEFNKFNFIAKNLKNKNFLDNKIIEKKEEVIEEKAKAEEIEKKEEVIEEKSLSDLNRVVSDINCQDFIYIKDDIYCWDGSKFNLKEI